MENRVFAPAGYGLITQPLFSMAMLDSSCSFYRQQETRFFPMEYGTLYRIADITRIRILSSDTHDNPDEGPQARARESLEPQTNAESLERTSSV